MWRSDRISESYTKGCEVVGYVGFVAWLCRLAVFMITTSPTAASQSNPAEHGANLPLTVIASGIAVLEIFMIVPVVLALHRRLFPDLLPVRFVLVSFLCLGASGFVWLITRAAYGPRKVTTALAVTAAYFAPAASLTRDRPSWIIVGSTLAALIATAFTVHALGVLRARGFSVIPDHKVVVDSTV